MPSQHPKEWSNKTHYGQCGQNCPCCRAFVTLIEKDTWEHGSCPICLEASRELKKEFWSGMEREMAIQAEAEAEAQRQMQARRKNWADMMDDNDELPPLPKMD